MKTIKTALALVLGTAVAGVACAQAPTATLQRDVNQQERIEQGLKSGSLNTREAGKLEREQSTVDRMQSRALRDGTVTPEEKAKLGAAQNKVSRDIYREKHDTQTGNPESASSRRMQADVARNVAQQKRIKQGIATGALNNEEAAALERGQARTAGKEAVAARNGRVGAREQANLQTSENRQSRRIFRKKHNAS